MSQEFKRDYLIRLPLPLAQLYSRAYNAKDARGRHDNTFYLFEALIKLATVPLVSAYLQEVQQGRPRLVVLDRLLGHLALPSLGQWAAMLRELSRHFGCRPDAPSHPLGHLWGQLSQPRQDRAALLALYRRIKNGVDGQPGDDQSCSLLQVLEALVQYRNGVFGHGAGRFLSFYEKEMGPLLYPAANELLAEGALDLLGPRGSRLVYLTELRTVDEGHVEAGLRELTGLQGERLAPLTLSPVQAAALLPNRVAVLWPGRLVPLRLDPLLLYREGELADDVLFLNRDRNSRQVEYLSYTTGRTERDRATAPALAALLSLVTNRAVSEEELKALAEQSLAETPSVEALFSRSAPAAPQLGDYQILAQIGKGGMGVVYLARQLSLGRLVALKMLPADLAGDEVALARFRREVRHLARCEHPNIVKVLSSGALPDGQPYYTMEYVPGCDLEMVWRELSGSNRRGDASGLDSSTWTEAVLAASRKQREQNTRFSPLAPVSQAPSEPTSLHPTASLPLPPFPDLPAVPPDPGGYVRRIALLIHDAALAVQAVHDQHVLHRDVKPGNLMLTPDGQRVVLMDFGLAKGQSLTLSASRQGGLLGTLRYAAPEQLAAASLPVGPAADVRGLGVTLWELLTRRRLFADAVDEKQLAQQIHDEDVPRLRTIDPTLHPDLEAIVTRATERRVADRIPTAALLAEYLQLWLDGRPLPIRQPAAAELVWRWARRHKAFVGSVLATGLAIITAVTVAFISISLAKDEAVDSAGRAVAARNDAWQAEREAQDAREKAVEEAERATKAEKQERAARQRAIEEATKATNAQKEEQKARRRAEEEWDRAEMGLHANRIVLAQREAEGRSFPHAREVLDRCRWDLRGWEWRHVRRRCPHEVLTLRDHSGPITGVCLSPDGSQVVGVVFYASVRVWDRASGQEIHNLKGHTATVRAVAYSPEGSRLASADSRGMVKVWDPATGKEKRSFRTDAPVNGLCFGPDGALVTAGDRSVKLWDPNTGQEVTTFQGPKEKVTAVCCSPDGTRLAALTEDKMVWVWVIRGADKPLSFPGDSFGALGFSPDGQRLAGVGDGLAVKIWDAGSGRELLSLDGHLGAVKSLAFSPDGRWLVTGSMVFDVGEKGGVTGGEIKMWDARTGKQVEFIDHFPEPITGVCFSGNGQYLAVAEGRLLDPKRAGRITVWDMRSGPAVTPFRVTTVWVSSVSFSPDGRRLAAGGLGPGGKDGVIHVWDARSGREIRSFTGHPKWVKSVCFSPDSKRLATGSDDGTVKVWDADGEELLTLRGHTSPVSGVRFSPDGKHLASAGGDTVLIWDARKETKLHSLRGHTDLVTGIDFSPDGKRLASSSWDRTVRVWDAATGKELACLRGHSDRVCGVCFHPDGRRLASGTGYWQSEDNAPGELKLWDAEEGRELLSFKGHTNDLTSLCFSPDGRRLVSASWDRTVRVWDVRSGQEVLGLKPHSFPMSAVAFSPDGQQLVTAGMEGTVKLWDATDSPDEGLLRGHTNTVLRVCFSPDSQVVVSGGKDGAVRLWDVLMGRELKNLHGHSGPVTCVGFDATGRRLASASVQINLEKTTLTNGELKVWDASTGKELLRWDKTEMVANASFSPDGRKLATVGIWQGQGETGRVGVVLKVRDSDSKEELFAITGDVGDFIGVRFSDDGERIVTGGAPGPSGGAGKSRAWNATTGKEITPCQDRPPPDPAGEFRSPDGQLVALTDGSKVIVRRTGVAPPEARVRRKEADARTGLAWHAQQALDAEQTGQWFAAAFHLNSLLRAEPDDVAWKARRGNARAELGDWKRAAEDLADASDSDLAGPDAWRWAAYIRLRDGDEAGYRRVCARVVKRLRDPSPSAEAARVCLLTADAVTDWGPVIKYAEAAVAKHSRDRESLRVLGAALFRDGQTRSAVVRLTQALKGESQEADAWTWLFLAQAQHSLDRPEQARESFGKAAALLARMERVQEMDPGKRLPWDRWFELQFLRREAESVIKGPRKPNP